MLCKCQSTLVRKQDYIVLIMRHALCWILCMLTTFQGGSLCPGATCITASRSTWYLYTGSLIACTLMFFCNWSFMVSLQLTQMCMKVVGICSSGQVDGTYRTGRKLLLELDTHGPLYRYVAGFPKKNVMICKGCTAKNLTGVVVQKELVGQGVHGLSVWVFDTGTIVHNVRHSSASLKIPALYVSSAGLRACLMTIWAFKVVSNDICSCMHQM